jgi:flagellar hook-basal body complex protein FliE
MNPIQGINPFSRAANNFKVGMAFPPTSASETFNTSAHKPSFKNMMVNMVEDTNKTLTQPDELMERAMTTGDVDIHEVMIANTKADIAINIVSQVATKVIQAYERVQQIQV